MPLFDFECPECGYEFEKIVYEDETVICPLCGAECEREMGNIAYFEFKGNLAC